MVDASHPDGKDHPPEVAESRVHGEARPPCHRGRDTPGRHLFTGVGEPDVGRPGTKAEGTLPQSHRPEPEAKVNLVRYADDFIITGSSKELLEEEVKPLVEILPEGAGLELSPEKTHITRIEDGFDFLGQNVRDYGGTILVKPSWKNVTTFLEKVRGIIKASEQATAGHLIVNLNPVIRGWANYHRHVSSKQTFSRVDHAIFQALWRWAKRRHPKKSRRWIKDRSTSRSRRGRHWVFTARSPAGRRRSNRSGSCAAASADPASHQSQRGSESV